MTHLLAGIAQPSASILPGPSSILQQPETIAVSLPLSLQTSPQPAESSQLSEIVTTFNLLLAPSSSAQLGTPGLDPAIYPTPTYTFTTHRHYCYPTPSFAISTCKYYSTTTS